MNLQDFAVKLQQQMQGRQSRFFGAARKGENYELRADLNSEYRDRRKDAIKRVIANMTVGKDVSGLFPDVLKNMQTEDLEQKKLVYLYLMNYAKTQPELVILAVNTFVKDTDDGNPLIRALAIRTMGCLRADKILDYISDPLRKCLSDDNPYVRKTAAICVAKLYDLKPSLAIENGFVSHLAQLISDANPMVVANAITALAEIQEVATNAIQASSNPDDSSSPQTSSQQASIFLMDSTILGKLLIALGECTEWGRIAILNAVATHRATDEKEAEHICERVAPQLQHANPSVVLAAIKCIMIHLNLVSRADFSKQMLRKMAPPLVTLISSPPEVQWVALRNISLILQKQPAILSSEMRVFFCKYNDPPYVKYEKLGIMVRLATEKNLDTLLSELREYASEADVDFVRKAIKAIGHCAVKLDAAAEKCVQALLDLIQTRITYVVQEAVVVLKDIFRKYPNRYEGVIPTLCSNLAELDEPEAKASLIWMVGEYAEQIDNADEILDSFVSSLGEETLPVQLQLLTATVKLFLKKPDTTQALIQSVLQFATKSCDNPDIRDRAFVYWRLLSSQPELTKSVVLAQRPSIEADSAHVPPALLQELVEQLGSLASVYHKPAETFVGRARLGAGEIAKKASDRKEDASQARALRTLVQGQQSENLLDMDEPVAAEGSSGGAGGSSAAANDFGLEGLSMSGGSTDASMAAVPKTSVSPPGSQQQMAQENPLDDLLGLFDSSGPAAGTAASPFGNLMPASSTNVQTSGNTTVAAGSDNLIDGFF